MTRSEFRAAYRMARSAYRFISAMHDITGEYPRSMFDTMRMCPGYCPTRLFGDRLDKMFGFTRAVHDNRMWDLRRRVRLPA